MPDFGFVGGAYEAPSIYQDAQELINWYCETDPTKAPGGPQGPPERGATALYPMPGYTIAAQPTTPGPARAMHTCSGGNELLVVCGRGLYSLSPSLAVTWVGNLTTTSGPVSIADNGIAALIVDSGDRYSYALGGGTFAVLPPTDGPWQGGSAACTLDNYILYARGGTQQFAATEALSTTTPALSFSSKDGSPDNLVAMAVIGRELFLLGETTTEAWVDVGSFPFPFARIPGSSTQHGLAAAESVSRLGESVAFVARDARGQGIIARLEGYGVRRLSTHAVEKTLIGQDLSTANAWTFQMGGHEFYVVTFPTIDLTWCYDLASDKWCKWLSYDSTGYHRHRGQCAASFHGKNLVGDYETGAIYELSTDVFTENGAAIRRLRRAIHLTHDLDRLFFHSLQLQFQPGVGIDGAGQGDDPQVMLRWSNDGGSTWSNEHWRTIGKIGRYRDRAIWRRLGMARDRVFEVSISDPVRAVVISAELRTSAGDN